MYEQGECGCLLKDWIARGPESQGAADSTAQTTPYPPEQALFCLPPTEAPAPAPIFPEKEMLTVPLAISHWKSTHPLLIRLSNQGLLFLGLVPWETRNQATIIFTAGTASYRNKRLFPIKTSFTDSSFLRASFTLCNVTQQRVQINLGCMYKSTFSVLIPP